MADWFLRAWVDDWKCFAAGRVDPLIVDEQLEISHKHFTTYAHYGINTQGR